MGKAIVDPVSREARWDGGKTRLQPQTLKVLLALATRRGEVMTRDELTQLCWDGRIVGDDVINRSISLLRHLAEQAGGFEIETIPRTGYRLVEGGTAGDRKGRARLVIAGTAALAVVGGALAFLSQQAAAPGATMTIAVHPFATPSADPTLNSLAKRTDEATARMLAENGISVAIATPASESAADFILSGSIDRAAGSQVATVRLDDPLRHAIVLSRRIEAPARYRDALPDQVGAQLSAALSAIGPLIRLDRKHPSDAVFVAALINTYLTNFDSQRAFEVARRTAPSAPNSAIAQLTLARLTGMNIMEVPPYERPAALAAGRIAAARLLRLAPHIGDSYVPWCLLHAEVRLAECESQLRKGLAAETGGPSVGMVYGHLLLNVGRLEESVPVAAETFAKDSYAPGIMAQMLLALDATGRSKEADELFARSRRLWPSAQGPLFKRVSGMLSRGDFESLSRLESELGPGGLPAGWPSIATPLARAIRERSLPLARSSCRDTQEDLKAIECMLALARLGDPNQAFGLAERLYLRRTGQTAAEEEAIWLSNPDNLDTVYLTASGAAPLRRDARFFALANRLGLVRYWRSSRLPDFCTRDHEPVCRLVARQRT